MIGVDRKEFFKAYPEISPEENFTGDDNLANLNLGNFERNNPSKYAIFLDNQNLAQSPSIIEFIRKGTSVFYRRRHYATEGTERILTGVSIARRMEGKSWQVQGFCYPEDTFFAAGMQGIKAFSQTSMLPFLSFESLGNPKIQLAHLEYYYEHPQRDQYECSLSDLDGDQALVTIGCLKGIRIYEMPGGKFIGDIPKLGSPVSTKTLFNYQVDFKVGLGVFGDGELSFHRFGKQRHLTFTVPENVDQERMLPKFLSDSWKDNPIELFTDYRRFYLVDEPIASQ